MVVKGLDSGADDYISKPFKRAEFLARIRAKLQLSSGVVEQVGCNMHSPTTCIALADACPLAGILCARQHAASVVGAWLLQAVVKSDVPHVLNLCDPAMLVPGVWWSC